MHFSLTHFTAEHQMPNPEPAQSPTASAVSITQKHTSHGPSIPTSTIEIRVGMTPSASLQIMPSEARIGGDSLVSVSDCA